MPQVANATPTAKTPLAIGRRCAPIAPATATIPLAPVDLALDGSLRPGDVVATTDGLAAYSGIRVGNDQAPDLTPVASFPGLTPEVRARLNAMKVAPVRADTALSTSWKASASRDFRSD